MKSIALLVAITFLTFGFAVAQSTVKGQITDVHGQPIVGATVSIKGTSTGTAADVEGNYILQNISQKGSTQLQVSAIGYERITKTVLIEPNSNVSLDFVLQEDTEQLDEVVITAKSEATITREQAYAVEVVEAEGFKNLSTSANDILGRISGVNIRQSGGVGSDFNLSLNGLSGNQVRIFLDGVPMDYFGSSLSLNNFSANLINRIEVYKGVVPVHLSSDALGGAVNVITNGTTQSYLDASYAIGSFGTHLSSLNGQYRNKNSGFTARLKSFYNFSKNNYKVPIKPLDLSTGKEAEEEIWVERFHDAYESKMAWADVGFTGTAFADQLMAGIMYSDNYKELQQPEYASGVAKFPYGEVASEEKKIITNLTLNKQDLFTKGLSLNSYFVAVFSESLQRDTASVRYDWFGNRTEKTDNTTGEIENRKTLFTLNTDNYLANINAEYQLTASQSVTLNYSLNRHTLQGADPFKRENSARFSNPNHLTKQILGASYTLTLLEDRLKNTVFGKYYDYSVRGWESDYSGDEQIAVSKEEAFTGFGFTTTYHLPKWQFKASFEQATRLPEVKELFGDGLNNRPNPLLKPEEGNNYNLGFIYTNRLPNSSFNVSLNGFYRDGDNYIFAQPQGIIVRRLNKAEVTTRGVDLSLGYASNEKWVVSFNGSYVEARDEESWRLPNMPYLFGNLNLSYRNDGLLNPDDHYSITYRQNYTHEFYFRWPNLASAGKAVVDAQTSCDVEFVYSTAEEKYNLSVSVINLLDAKLYDNFQQLRPGRNFNVKLRYFLN
ncbi:TonB-dependent receptor [Fulvivirga sp. RKSG066]|uniref:TonB-dependent receptor n=1 Tax=Fulvivirga aurantia TaxID=2529383 RepID=UPI0012BC04E4|nr:TonB-dependent receptor [Fulvivirga aurantia]MTI21581.1 TonB-dependent receptor [Fulvivirga aurantia]